MLDLLRGRAAARPPRLGPAPEQHPPDPVQEVLVAPLPRDELGEQALAVGPDGPEAGRAAGVAPAQRHHHGHLEALLGQGFGGPLGRRPAARGAEQEVDQRPGRPAKRGPADHVQRQVGADVHAREADPYGHRDRHPAGPPAQIGGDHGGDGHSHGGVPGHEPEAAVVVAAKVDVREQVGRPPPAHLVLDPPGGHPHPDPGDGQVGGQPEPAGGRHHQRRHPDGEHVTGLHHHPERREQGRREVVDQPEQVGLERPDVVGADGGRTGEQDGHPGDQPDGVAGVAGQGQDLAGSRFTGPPAVGRAAPCRR